MKQLEPIHAVIRAPQVFVFQALTSFGEPSAPWFRGDLPEVLERRGTILIVRFCPRLLGRAVPTVQRVRLYPPARVTYEHLDGEFADVREEITLAAEDGVTHLEHRADISVTWRPVARLLKRFVAAPVLRREMERTVERYRVTIEAAARAAGLAEACPEHAASANGTSPNGAAPEAHSANGTSPNGVAPDAITLIDLSPKALPLDEISLIGSPPSRHQVPQGGR